MQVTGRYKERQSRFNNIKALPFEFSNGSFQIKNYQLRVLALSEGKKDKMLKIFFLHFLKLIFINYKYVIFRYGKFLYFFQLKID